VAELGSHLAGCGACRSELTEEQALTRRLREVARYRPPEPLRAQVQRELERKEWRGIRTWIQWRWLAAAAVVLLIVGISLAVREWRDPLRVFIAEAATNHRQLVLQQEFVGFPDVGPWGPAELPRILSERLGLPVETLFLGDAELSLMGVRPLMVGERKGVALLYADRHGRMSSLLLVPAPEMELPERKRMQIETFRPYHTTMDSYHVLVWKQKELACSLVVRADDRELADLFMKIRKAM
jgi:anti-sigma factor RsiW